MRRNPKSLKLLLATLVLTPAAALVAPPGALAQPLVLNVSPGRNAGVVVAGGAPASVQDLFTSGPHYTEPSGRRIGRGSVIPTWIDVGSFQNVSVPRLRRGGSYGYFVSPDNKVVVLDPRSRRVRRVIGP
jgi:hypothetical protein